MTTKKILFTALVAMGFATLSAQTIYDAARLTQTDLNGTARFVGMGGAMGALGGDISTIGTNPAGIGLFRRSEGTVSFGMSSYGTESKFQGQSWSNDKMRGDLNNAGFVLSTKFGNQTALRYLNFGFNYQRVKSFYNNMQMRGNLGDYSQTYYMANQANDITNWSDPYPDSDIGWLSHLGYNGYLITDAITESELNDIIAQNPGYKADPYLVNGVHASNLDGEKLYRTPGEYVGMYNGAESDFRSQQRGGIDRFDFNMAFNLRDRVYLGLTIGAYAVDYNKYTYYAEDFGADEKYNLQTWSGINGAGFDFKLGAIVRPFEYSPLRIGFAIHSPIFYNLDYTTNARLESDVVNPLDIPNEVDIPSGDIGLYDIDMGDYKEHFKLQTPWTYQASLGYTVGSSLALGAEYEYKDYSAIRFKDDNGYTDSYELENSSANQLKGVHTVRLGLEYKVIPEFAIRAGYNFQSAVFDKNAYKDIPYFSAQTDTDFTNTQELGAYTLGVGYRGKMFFADLAYKYTTVDGKFYPFDTFDGSSLQQAVSVKDTRSQVLFTIGMRF